MSSPHIRTLHLFTAHLDTQEANRAMERVSTCSEGLFFLLLLLKADSQHITSCQCVRLATLLLPVTWPPSFCLSDPKKCEKVQFVERVLLWKGRGGENSPNLVDVSSAVSENNMCQPKID